MSRPLSKTWLASVLLPPAPLAAARAAGAADAYLLSPDVFVRLVGAGVGGGGPSELQKMRLVVDHFPDAPCTIENAKKLSNGLWRKVRGQIPKTIGQGLVRQRWSVKVRPSTTANTTRVFSDAALASASSSSSSSSPLLFFELTVNYQAVGAAGSSSSSSAATAPAPPASTTLDRIPDEVLIHNLSGFLAPADIARLAASACKLQTLLLTSSYCLNTVLTHARENVHALVSRLAERVDVARYRLRKQLSKLEEQADDSEWNALQGAVASWSPASASISPGMLQCVAVLFALCEIDLGRCSGTVGIRQLADGVQVLALASKDGVQTSRLVNMLLRHGDSWVRCLQAPPKGLDPAPPPTIADAPRECVYRLRQTAEDVARHQRLRLLFPKSVSRMFRRCAHDPTFLCVDSAPLQRLSQRLRAICVGCQHVCESEAPRTRAAAGREQVRKSEQRIVKWFELGGCAAEVPLDSTVCVEVLGDFGKVGWPRVEVELARSVLRELHEACRVL